MARGKIAKKCAKAMKPSGVAWLGDIPEGWEMLPARHLFAEVTAKNKNGKYTRQLSFRYGEIVDKGPNQSHNAFPEETILTYTVVEPDTIMINGLNLNYDLLSLRVAIVKEAGIITSAYLAVVPQRSRIIPWYALYLLKAYDFKMVFHGQGSGIRMTLKFADFATLPITLPPLPEQRAIADYLDEKCGAIDAAIAEAKKGIEEYKAWKKSLIFEAVTGKRRVGAFNAKTQSRREAEKMKHSGIPWIGGIPEGWEKCKTLHALRMPITDGPHTTPDLFNDGIPFVSAEAVSCGNGSIDFNHIRGYISEAFYNECCLKYIPKRDDIYMIKSGATTGRVAIVDTDRIFTIWSPLAVFRCNQQRAKPRYLFYYLQSSAYQGQVELAWSFGTQQNIGMRALEELKVILPPLPEQQAIADYLDEKCATIDAMVAEKEALIADLEAYKKSLIYEVVTGKREVA